MNGDGIEIGQGGGAIVMWSVGRSLYHMLTPIPPQNKHRAKQQDCLVVPYCTMGRRSGLYGRRLVKEFGFDKNRVCRYLIRGSDLCM